MRIGPDTRKTNSSCCSVQHGSTNEFLGASKEDSKKKDEKHGAGMAEHEQGEAAVGHTVSHGKWEMDGCLWMLCCLSKASSFDVVCLRHMSTACMHARWRACQHQRRKEKGQRLAEPVAIGGKRELSPRRGDRHENGPRKRRTTVYSK